MNFREIQEAQVEWVRHNFDVDPYKPLRHQPLLGMVEEFGELAHALNHILIHPRKPDEAVLNDAEDALADIVIYACDYATSMGWDMSKVQGYAQMIEPRKGLTDSEIRQMCSFLMLRIPCCLGEMSHACLKESQGIRGSSEKHREAGELALVAMLNRLYELGWYLDIDLQEAASKVWGKVRQRDWKKDPDHANQNV